MTAFRLGLNCRLVDLLLVRGAFYDGFGVQSERLRQRLSLPSHQPHLAGQM